MKYNNNTKKNKISFNIIYGSMPNNYDEFVNSELSKISNEMFKNGSPEAIKILLNLHDKYPTIPEVMNNLAVCYKQQGDMEKAEKYLQKLTKTNPNYFFGRFNRSMKALDEDRPEEFLTIFNNCFNIKDLYPERNNFHISEVSSFTYVLGLYFCAINNLKTAQIHYNFLVDLIGADDPKSKNLHEKIINKKFLKSNTPPKAPFIDPLKIRTMTFYQMIQKLNQENVVPFDAIQAALDRSEEFTPALLDEIKDITENFQTIDLSQVYYITILFIFAKLKEKKAFPYIIKIASLYRDWPEKILGDVKTEGLPNLLVSTYNGDLKAIKNLIENTYANLWCRVAGLNSLCGLFAIGTLTRQEVLDYFHSLLLNETIIQDGEFYPWIINEMTDLYPEEFLDTIIPLTHKEHYENVITQEDIEETIELGLEECLNQNIYANTFIAPVNNVVDHVFWLYRPQEDENEEKKDAEKGNPEYDCQRCYFYDEQNNNNNEIFRQQPNKISRNELCPCNSGKKYKKCCLLL